VNISTEQQLTRVVCPHCDAVNRVLSERLTDAPVCGSCKQPLFLGSPLEVTEAQFKSQLAHTEVPVIVDFWAPWCAPCRSMAPTFERAAAAVEPRARFLKVNTDNEQALAGSLDVRGNPT
jgi:thioredoxin 2